MGPALLRKIRRASPTTPPSVHVEHDPIFFQNRDRLTQLIALAGTSDRSEHGEPFFLVKKMMSDYIVTTTNLWLYTDVPSIWLIYSKGFSICQYKHIVSSHLATINQDVKSLGVTIIFHIPTRWAPQGGPPTSYNWVDNSYN